LGDSFWNEGISDYRVDLRTNCKTRTATRHTIQRQNTYCISDITHRSSLYRTTAESYSWNTSAADDVNISFALLLAFEIDRSRECSYNSLKFRIIMSAHHDRSLRLTPDDAEYFCSGEPSVLLTRWCRIERRRFFLALEHPLSAPWTSVRNGVFVSREEDEGDCVRPNQGPASRCIARVV
jgi:hypothetical protein